MNSITKNDLIINIEINLFIFHYCNYSPIFFLLTLHGSRTFTENVFQRSNPTVQVARSLDWERQRDFHIFELILQLQSHRVLRIIIIRKYSYVGMLLFTADICFYLVFICQAWFVNVIKVGIFRSFHFFVIFELFDAIYYYLIYMFLVSEIIIQAFLALNILLIYFCKSYPVKSRKNYRNSSS